MKCLICGGALQAIQQQAQPPWRCAACYQSFYACELTREARAAWRPSHRDFGKLTAQLQIAARAEQHGKAT